MADLVIHKTSKQCLGYGNCEYVDSRLRINHAIYTMFTPSNTEILSDVPQHPHGPVECWIYDNGYSVFAPEALGVWLSEYKATLVSELESLADAVGERFVSSGVRISEYMAAKEEATAYKATNYSGGVPASVQTWAIAAGISNATACDDILRDADYLYGVQMSLRQKRLAARELIKNGDYNTSYSAYISTKKDLLAIMSLVP